MPSPTKPIDPLRPQHTTAPEISGYGTSQQQQTTTDGQDGDHHDNSDSRPSTRFASSTCGSLISLICFLTLFTLIFTSFGPHTRGPTDPPVPVPRPGPGSSIDARVNDILTHTPLIDGHTDLAIAIRALYHNNISSPTFRSKFENGTMPFDVDLPRLRSGQSGGALWSAFVTCPANASQDFSDAQYATAVSHTVAQIDMLKQMQQQYPERFTPADSSMDTMLDGFERHRKLFGPISIEGLHQISQISPMSTLRIYYAVGVRAATLTWNCHNAFADAALLTAPDGTTTIAPYHRGGLTPRGRQVIQEMNRLGMLVDISHTSYWTQKAVLSNGTSRAPVIYSHSSAWSLCPHPRNVKNDILDLVRATGSLVMVNFSPNFISCTPADEDDSAIQEHDRTSSEEKLPVFYRPNNTLHQVARHVKYIGDRIGYDHVGLGSDFDGMGDLKPTGLEGVDKYPDLVAELLRMGVSDASAHKIVGGNFLRVWREAERVAAAMQLEGVLPAWDENEGF